MALADVVLVVMLPVNGSFVTVDIDHYTQDCETPMLIIVKSSDAKLVDAVRTAMVAERRWNRFPDLVKPRSETNDASAPLLVQMLAVLPSIPNLRKRRGPETRSKRDGSHHRDAPGWLEHAKNPLKDAMFARSGKRHW